MREFKDTVPFDPGYSSLSFSFMGNMMIAMQEYNALKAPHQKKFWLMKSEDSLVEFIEKSTAFYLGCMLWGSFIHFKFKNEPKKITGNNTEGLSEEELKDFDCASEVKAILEYIKTFDRDCKYFLKHPAKIKSEITKILESYVEFAQINNNFIGVNKTSDIKTPTTFAFFKKLSEKELDKLCDEIFTVIESGKIEGLLSFDICKNL